MCDHSVSYNGLCALCGADISANGEPMHFAIHSTTSIKVSKSIAKVSHESIEDLLLRQQKLTLILDLDNTLIHASLLLPGQETSSSSDYVIRPEDNPSPHVIRLRPWLFRFLESIRSCFELHVYTMGSRGYAKEVVRVIDKEGSLFGDRVVARDSEDSTVKRLDRIVPFRERTTAILDDRSDVWKGHEAQLIRIRPFFSDLADDQLLLMERVLLEVHQVFFSSPGSSQSVGASIDSVRKRVLRGVALFIGAKSLDIDAKRWGAVVVERLSLANAVLVSSAQVSLTEKSALLLDRLQIPVVSSEWFFKSVERWESLSMTDFRVNLVIQSLVKSELDVCIGNCSDDDFDFISDLEAAIDVAK